LNEIKNQIINYKSDQNYENNKKNMNQKISNLMTLGNAIQKSNNFKDFEKNATQYLSRRQQEKRLNGKQSFVPPMSNLQQTIQRQKSQPQNHTMTK
jgi:hypothetical protein